jgi:hypothetical protein
MAKFKDSKFRKNNTRMTYFDDEILLGTLEVHLKLQVAELIQYAFVSSMF